MTELKANLYLPGDKNAAAGHLHDGIILLPLLLDSFSMLLSSVHQRFCYLNLTGITRYK